MEFKIDINELKTYPYTPKVWGGEITLVNAEYCAKFLLIKQGGHSSLHYHEKKHEHFIILTGDVLLEKSGRQLLLRKYDIVEVLPYERHRFTGVSNSIILEVSTHHDEADTVRIEPSWAE